MYYIPYVNLPLIWSETFFHEISHGIAALITGGSIVSIDLSLNGEGHCITRGGNQFLVGFSGYAGSALWGFLIFVASDSLAKNKSRIVVSLVILIIVLTIVLWARDIVTIFILLSLTGMYLAIALRESLRLIKYFISFVGVFVMLDAIRSPLVLFDGQSIGDGATLASKYVLPEFLWISIWVLISLTCLVAAYKVSVSNK